MWSPGEDWAKTCCVSCCFGTEKKNWFLVSGFRSLCDLVSLLIPDTAVRLSGNQDRDICNSATVKTSHKKQKLERTVFWPLICYTKKNQAFNHIPWSSSANECSSRLAHERILQTSTDLDTTHLAITKDRSDPDSYVENQVLHTQCSKFHIVKCDFIVNKSDKSVRQKLTSERDGFFNKLL